jgi:hypothetical protein
VVCYIIKLDVVRNSVLERARAMLLAIISSSRSEWHCIMCTDLGFGLIEDII